MPPFFKNNVLMSQLVQQLMSTRSSLVMRCIKFSGVIMLLGASF